MTTDPSSPIIQPSQEDLTSAAPDSTQSSVSGASLAAATSAVATPTETEVTATPQTETVSGTTTEAASPQAIAPQAVASQAASPETLVTAGQTAPAGSSSVGVPPTVTNPTASAPVSAAPPVSPALPDADTPEPPRALVPGAFLRLEFEIKQVVSRGLTNLYLAQAGDYGQAVPKLIAERAPVPATPVATASPDTPDTTNREVAATGDTHQSATEEEEMQGGALEGEALAELSESASTGDNTNPADQTVATDETVATNETAASTPSPEHTWGDASPQTPSGEVVEPLQSALFPSYEKFTQDEREYLVFDYDNSTALQDYREPTNDVRYLQVLNAVAQGLLELETKKLSAPLTRELLRVDPTGAIRYYGFVQPGPQQDNDASGVAAVAGATPPALEQLREVNNFLLKHVFAESSTMRLGDEFGSLVLSEEVKEIARRLHEREFASMSDVVAAIGALYNPGARLQVQAALMSDVGRERELNEDSGMIVHLQRSAHLGTYEFDLFVVADGMGGHEGGEVASNLTLSSLQRNLSERMDIDWNDNVLVRQALLDIIDAVNAEVVALTETPQYRAMRAKPGSTLTFAVRLGPRVFVGNVGDSRAYKYNETIGLQRISKDHSYVQSLIDRGELTEEEAWDHPEGSIITANIGDPKLRLRDVFLRLFAPGDKLLLVSDGVVDMLRDRDIVTFLPEPDDHMICQNLVNASNAAGGADNITVVSVTFA